jgi:crotonobetainyl-CoA:carnitine CoA-transferase CaiB-like acyl-CoA transferase
VGTEAGVSGPAGAGPLAGVRVLDLTSVVFGPFATQLLAELGAEVVKVEAPEGDNMRHSSPARTHGMGALFLNLNRGKRSVVLDLKQAEAREALLRMARSSDALISNIRPRALARLGLDYETVREENPSIVYVLCVGFGQSGPYAERPAYDDLVQGSVGIPWLMQEAGASRPNYVPLTLVDRITGIHAAYALAAALFERERSGRGQVVEVPMFEAIAQFVLGDHLGGLTFEPALGGPGYDRLLVPDRRPYETADGHLCLLVYNDKQWRSFLALVGEPERFEADPRFGSQAARARHYDEVYAYVAEMVRGRTTAEWAQALADADIPHMPMNSLDDVVADRHLGSVGFLREQDHPTEGRVRTIGSPTSWSRSGSPEVSPAPRLGEHSLEMLREIGYPDEVVEAMLRDGATATPDDG